MVSQVLGSESQFQNKPKCSGIPITAEQHYELLERRCDAGIILLIKRDLNLEHCSRMFPGRQKKKTNQKLSPSLIMLTFLYCIKTADNLDLDKKLPIHFQNTCVNHQKLDGTFTVAAFPDL